MTYVAGDLRDQLAYLGRDVVRAGLVVGSGGNLSARLPDGDDCWVTGSGTWLDRLDRASFVRVRIADGCPLPGGPSPDPEPAGAGLPDLGLAGTALDAAPHGQQAGPPHHQQTDRPLPPTSELALHLAVYRARPDVSAVVHLHPQSMLLLDAIGVPIRLVSTDHAFYLRRVVTVPFAPPGGQRLAQSAADAAADGTNCLILSRHGCSVLAGTVELAHKRAVNLEEAARLTYRALAVGRLDELTPLPADYLDRLPDPDHGTI
ncbi:class II aldolase/adducin family protein [Micromonospora sp. NBC_01813]|uniref:class II aldolase/adducin family protein n=1 Tax=Micromonospora sp. NBC_01813 TaxID=2975988 RepID=UPI002DDBAAB4|nr:class II aldolase/adducin family protein [Micromonospora sp. NBC_01813]WSA07403.1 class II aldolase/adducin family protein [Micromonospora sp. NBC_01813]